MPSRVLNPTVDRAVDDPEKRTKMLPLNSVQSAVKKRRVFSLQGQVSFLRVHARGKMVGSRPSDLSLEAAAALTALANGPSTVRYKVAIIPEGKLDKNDH